MGERKTRGSLIRSGEMKRQSGSSQERGGEVQVQLLGSTAPSPLSRHCQSLTLNYACLKRIKVSYPQTLASNDSLVILQILFLRLILCYT